MGASGRTLAGVGGTCVSVIAARQVGAPGHRIAAVNGAGKSVVAGQVAVLAAVERAA